MAVLHVFHAQSLSEVFAAVTQDEYERMVRYNDTPIDYEVSEVTGYNAFRDAPNDTTIHKAILEKIRLQLDYAFCVSEYLESLGIEDLIQPLHDEIQVYIQNQSWSHPIAVIPIDTHGSVGIVIDQ